MCLVPSGLGYRVCSLETVTVPWSAGGQTLLPVQGGYWRRYPCHASQEAPTRSGTKAPALSYGAVKRGCWNLEVLFVFIIW